MKLGVFGGSFDPVHLGHLLLAETARDLCRLDEVWFVPAAQSPFKPGHAPTLAKHRLEMLRLAVAGHAKFRVCDVELERPAPSYTVDTLLDLQRQLPDAELHLVMGADSLADFPKWREPHEILRLSRIVAVNRANTIPQLASFLEQLGDIGKERLQIIEMPAVEVSATAIRHMVRQGRSIRYQVPRAVELYIQEHKLYAEGGLL